MGERVSNKNNMKENFMLRENMLEELEKISNSKTWKMLISDGWELYLYSLPFFRERTEVFIIKDRSKEKFIGKYKLSPNCQKVIFSVNEEKKAKSENGEELYLTNYEFLSLTKIDNVPTSAIIGFVGNNKLLLEGYPSAEGKYLYIFELGTQEKDVLYELGESTVGKCYANASHTGELLVYDSGDGFVVYDVKNRLSRKIQIDGDRPILSPDGKWILFRRGGMTGSYYTINVDGLNESLVLPERKIRMLLHDSGGYRDLNFISWSPDSRFILLQESSDLQKGRTFVLRIDTKEIIEITTQK